MKTFILNSEEHLAECAAYLKYDMYCSYMKQFAHVGAKPVGKSEYNKIYYDLRYPASNIPEEDDSEYLDGNDADPEEGVWDFYFNEDDELMNLEKEEGEKYLSQFED